MKQKHSRTYKYTHEHIYTCLIKHTRVLVSTCIYAATYKYHAHNAYANILTFTYTHTHTCTQVSTQICM